MEKYKAVFDRIKLPFSRKSVLDDGLVTAVIPKGDVLFLTLNGNLGHNVNDLSFIKRKIECAFDEILSVKAVCIVESSDPAISNVNTLKQTSDISGMFTPVAKGCRTVCVVSGKGGVGKTSCAIILANSLLKMGYKVGLADLDIYGPSIPSNLSINHKHEFKDGKIVPYQKGNLSVASIGMMIDSNEPIIWRGPMLSKAIHQLIREVDWSGLDFLVIDTPPGTGDVHLTLAQKMPIDKIVCVTTNDPTSVQNTRKSINMLRRLGFSVDRLLINMSHIEKDGAKTAVFGELGFAKQEISGDFVGGYIEIPLSPTYKDHIIDATFVLEN